jgi:hypothetical protein
MNRAREAAYWMVPPLLCLVLYWSGFRSWFRADDFAWLGLGATVHTFRDLLRALFAPFAQGTIRPWSDRVFFMAGFALFGLSAMPFRIVIFLTQFANLALVQSIGSRLTGMRAAGFCAALLWLVNGALYEPLGWASAYNQLLCGFFLLLAFHCLLRHIESGERRYNIYQWIAFLLGFGALELNVVYPALAAGYTAVCAPRYFRRTLPLFIPAVIYATVHAAITPVPKTGVYAMHFSSSIVKTLFTY